MNSIEMWIVYDHSSDTIRHTCRSEQAAELLLSICEHERHRLYSEVLRITGDRVLYDNLMTENSVEFKIYKSEVVL